MSEDNKVAPSRFSILVPEPKTRLNMGKPEAGANAFGYPGISLQAEGNFFADIAKTLHVQSAFKVHLQAGDHWDQFAYKNMTMAANLNATLAANAKVVIAAGAGQPNFPTIPYGESSPTWIDYNNLKLHYTIDTVSLGLKKLFYGAGWETEQKKPKTIQDKWFSDDPPPMTDGMLHELDTMLLDLGYDRKAQASTFTAFLRPLKWAPDFISAQPLTLPWNWETSEFKFLVSADPYAPSAVMGLGPARVWTKFMAYVLQTGVLVKRLSDTLEALIPSIAEFALISRIRGLVFAARSFNEAIVKTDPNAWKQFNPNASDNAWKQVEKQSMEPFSAETWKKSTAELTSAPEPYDLSNCSSFELEVLDKVGGPASKVDFSALGTPAKMTLTLKDEFTAIAPTLTVDHKLSLGGIVVCCTAAGAIPEWSHGDAAEDGLPEGFTYASGRLAKGGELFTAEESSPALSFQDRTFETGTLALVVDGTPYAVPGLAALNALSGNGRATQLAAKLNGVGGATATASNATVIVTSPSVGGRSSLALAASVPVHGELGLEGEGKRDAARLTAEQLRAYLEGKGNFTVELQGLAPARWLEVKHNVSGKPGYLEFGGEPAKVFFGKDPASAEGTDPGNSAKDVQAPLNALFEITEGNAVNALFRPVLDAVQQVVEVWGKIEDAVKGLQAAFTPQKVKPHLMLTAGVGGVTVATNGAVNEVGHSVTLIAAGNMEEPNSAKFTPLIEHVMHAVEEGSEALEHYFWGNPYHADLFPKGSGAMNLISSGPITMVGAETVNVLSQLSFNVIAKNVEAVSHENLTIAAHRGTVLLRGPTIQLGDVTPAGVTAKARMATASVVLDADNTVSARTKAVGIWLDDAKTSVSLGSRAAAAFDSAKMGLTVKPAEIVLGDAEAKLKLAGKEATLTAKTKIVLHVDGKSDLEATGGKVTIHGDLDVGGVLSVKGMPMPAPPDIPSLAAVNIEFAALKGQLAAMEATAKLLEAAVKTADAAIVKVREDLVPMVVLAGQKLALEAAELVRATLREQLEALDAKQAELEAKVRALGRADALKPRRNSI